MIVNTEVVLDPFTDVDFALRRLKKQMTKAGLFKEMKKRTYYEKPSEKRNRKQREARKTQRKAQKAVRAKRDLVYDDRKPNHYNGDYVPSPHYKGNRT